VRDQHQTLLNTFTRAFEAAPGMAQHHAISAQSADALSLPAVPARSSLLPALVDFSARCRFPAGSMHLRESTTWGTLILAPGGKRRFRCHAG
jgi:hypothetical protein